MALGTPVFSRAESLLKKKALRDPFAKDEFKSVFIIKVLVGTEIPLDWHRKAKTYHEVLEAYDRFTKTSPRLGHIDVCITYNTRFLSREWCNRATVVFVAQTNRVTCLNHVINGIHEFSKKYQHTTDLEEVALNGGFN